MTSLTNILLTITAIMTERQTILNELGSRNEWLDSYDYIIVGAGSAGGVIANRLSRDKQITVLLLEAGGVPVVDFDIPVGVSYPFRNQSEYFWQYFTVPQTNICQDLPQKRCAIIGGKVLGGSSTVNSLVYTRGNQLDYDNWQTKYGANGWSYKQVLKYFLKAENNSDSDLVANNREYHSTTGPLGVSTHRNADPFLVQYLLALNQLGYNTVDLNGANQTGAALAQSNIDSSGFRSSTLYAYLAPARRRQNLHIMVNSLATKITFDNSNPNNPIANGITFIRDGQHYTVKANREVIISAGAIQSPQLLLLSGVGPVHHLNSLNIPIISDLPVGDNFHDHVYARLQYRLLKPEHQFRSRETTVDNLYHFFVDRNQNKSSNLSLKACIFLYFSTEMVANNDWPNSRFQVYPTYEPKIDEFVINVNAVILRPKSRGTLRLSSTNPLDAPLIDPNYYSSESDTKTMIAIIRKAIAIHKLSPLNDYLELISPELDSCGRCPDQTFECETFVRCLLRHSQHSGPYYHHTGGCRMGSAHDNEAVVDERLRVRRVSRLRVADASVMPEVIGGGLHAPAIMIGEKCSDMIIEDNAGSVSNRSSLANSKLTIVFISVSCLLCSYIYLKSNLYFKMKYYIINYGCRA